MKKTLALVLALVLALSVLAGCGQTAPKATEAPAATAEPTPAPTPTPTAAPTEDDDENYDTGDASKDDPLNQDNIGENELLVVSFGTSYNDSRRENIGAIEKALAEEFPEYSVRRAFTSQIIIDHVLKRDGEKIDNLTEALDRAVANKVKRLVVQPTHLMGGLEYTDIVNEVAKYADAFEDVRVGWPLLHTREDFSVLALALLGDVAEKLDNDTAVVFMGHGTEAASNAVYAEMQSVFTQAQANNVFVGTVEAEPSLDDVLKLVQAGSFKRVVLQPMMIVAGDHANNDMAGDEPDSWKSKFEAAGYEVECVLKGLGSNEMVRDQIIEHTAQLIEEDFTTGDASLDDPLNADEIGETELLVVSFGTSFNDSRRETIGAIEKALAAAFPEYSVRRAFTSDIIIGHIERRDGVKIDTLTEALDRAVANKVKTLIVQPTHLMPGYEYNDVINEIASYSDAFEKVIIGRPVLDTDADFTAVANAITAATAEYDDGETAIVFMGHGTEAESNGVYAKMQSILTGMGKTNYFIGTVEAEPSVDDVLALVKAGTYKRVVLEPLMIVAGDHAHNDMAGGEEDSWNTVFQSAGYKVETVLKGLGSFEPIQQLLVDHAKAAIAAAN